MKKQFLYLVLLGLLCSIGNVWADETYYLQTPSAETPALTGEFFTSLSLNQDQSCSYNDVDYSKVIKFNGNVNQWSSMQYTDRAVRYDCKTDWTEFTVVVYNNNGNSKSFYVGDVKENAIGTACTPNPSSNLTSVSTTKDAITTKTYTIDTRENPKAASFFVGSGVNNNVYLVQIIAVEKGTPLPTPGSAGYAVNFNKGRVICPVSSGQGTTHLDGSDFELNLSSTYKAGNSTYAQFSTKGTNYIKFTVSTPMILNFTTANTNQYTVSKTKGDEENKITPTANTAKKIKLTSAGTYYINPQGSGVQATGLSFSAAPTVTYNANGGSGEMGQTYFTVAENGFTAPVVGQVFDGWKDGEGTDYAVDQEIESDVTLYAQWRTPATKHSVEYSLGAATGTLPTQADVEEGQNFTVAAVPGDLVPPTGKRFKTWNDGSADYAPGVDYKMSTSNVTLTAIYENIYAISEGTHDGGYITINKDIAAEAEVVTLTSTPKPGYSFTSWSITKTEDGSSTGISVSDNKFNMPAYAITVNAIFTNTDSRKQILYLTSTSESDTKKDDKLYEALNSVDDYNVLIAAPGLQVPTDYDLVVLHESLDGATYYNHAVVAAAKNGNVPVLNTKSYFYTSARWNWGTPNAGKSEKVATLNTAYSNIEDHPIFAGLTITSNKIEVVGTAEAKAMQPIGSFTSGYEGYTLATTSNASSGQGTAIHELTPAQRGVASAKYLMISVSNSKLNDLSTDGQLLFKNAAAYLIDGSSWTPTISATITSAGWATFCSPYALDFSGDIEHLDAAYIVTGGATGVLSMDEITGTVPANTGLLLKGEGECVIPVVASSSTNVSANKLEGVTEATEIAANTGYVLMGTPTLGFYKNANAFTLGANTAYLPVGFTGSTPDAAPSLFRIVEENQNATNIENIEANDKAVKFIENGRILILRDGITYDALGRKIR